jgi:hypothetical protein
MLTRRRSLSLAESRRGLRCICVWRVESHRRCLLPSAKRSRGRYARGSRFARVTQIDPPAGQEAQIRLRVDGQGGPTPTEESGDCPLRLIEIADKIFRVELIPANGIVSSA